MNWSASRAGAYAQVSECGRYSVCRIGTAGGQFYEAWKTRAHDDGPGLIATNLPSSQAAREAAEEDAGD